MKRLLLAGTAVAAILLATGAVRAADVVAEPTLMTNWSGFYIGGHVGYGWANMDGCFDCTDDSSALFASDLDLEGIVGGLHAGYNWQMDDIVFGLEGDVTFTDLSDSGLEPSDSQEGQHGEVDLLASVRARLGIVIEENTLAYVTGGIAIPDAEWRADDAGKFKFGEIGGVVGGGFEHALSDSLRLRAEGLYYFFGEDESVDDISDASTGEAIEFEDALVVRGGLSLYFNQ